MPEDSNLIDDFDDLRANIAICILVASPHSEVEFTDDIKMILE